jgi:hypothetical protein
MTFPAKYSGWISYVRDWIGADEYSDAKIAAFLDLAHIRMNREMSAYGMEKRAEIVIAESMVGQAITILDVVPDFNRVRLVSVRGIGPLDVDAINEIQISIQTNPDPGDTPMYYSIDAGSLYVYPGLGEGSIIDFFYYCKVPELSTEVDTNVFSIDHPDALLYAACLEAAPYMVEDERIPIWENKYVTAVAVANDIPNRIKMGSTPLKRQIKGLS